MLYIVILAYINLKINNIHGQQFKYLNAVASKMRNKIENIKKLINMLPIQISSLLTYDKIITDFRVSETKQSCFKQCSHY